MSSYFDRGGLDFILGKKPTFHEKGGQALEEAAQGSGLLSLSLEVIKRQADNALRDLGLWWTWPSTLG